ncbi:MAG: hypothetical protein HY043_11290 [Verrucomicrobia bacterium]|nr:hypothetical protein [Verrucomicrobiota bacterium]
MPDTFGIVDWAQHFRWTQLASPMGRGIFAGHIWRRRWGAAFSPDPFGVADGARHFRRTHLASPMGRGIF